MDEIEDPYLRALHEDARRKLAEQRTQFKRRRKYDARKKALVSEGDRFGLLTVVHYNPLTNGCFCHCDCGAQTYAQATTLLYGRKKSCGCARKRKEDQCPNTN